MVVLPVLIAISVVILLSAVVSDVAFRIIPNWMPSILLLLAGYIRMLDGSLVLSLLICGLIFLGTTFCWLRGWLGGGDVKLLAACGLLVPPGLTAAMLLDMALAGGVLALLYLALGRMLATPQVICPTGSLRRIIWEERHRIHGRSSLPYASAIAAGALLVLLKG